MNDCKFLLVFFFFCYHFEMRELYARVTTKYTLRRSIILLLLLFFLDFSFFFLFCYMKLEKYNFCILIFFSSFSFILQNEKKNLFSCYEYFSMHAGLVNGKMNSRHNKKSKSFLRSLLYWFLLYICLFDIIVTMDRPTNV